MKKIWKHQWKYYMFFFVLMLIVLFVMNGLFELSEVAWVLDYDSTEMLYSSIERVIGTVAITINDNILHRTVTVVFVEILVVKGIFFWLERDNSGREFLSTLPITRTTRFLFHFVMDSLLIICVCSGYSVYLYLTITGHLTRQELSAAWAGNMIFGESVTSIGYLLLLLSVINVFECIFVDGFIRILGTAGSIYMCKLIMDSLFDLNPSSKWIQKLYGFLMMKSPGGGYYEKGVISLTDSLGRASQDWVYKDIVHVVLYKGETILVKTAGFLDGMSGIGYLIGYMFLGICFMGIALYLYREQELSKHGFYFNFGRYLFCGLLCSCFVTVMLINAVSSWNKGLIIASGIILFMILVYSMEATRAPFPCLKRPI